MALLDTQVAMLANLGAGYLASGVAPQRAGNAHQNIVPYQVFEVADGHLILAVGNDAQFARFCAVAGCAELAADPRFARNAGRVRHRATLVPLLAARLKLRPRAAWLAALEAAKVPCGPINDLAEVFADPQVRERGDDGRDAASARRHGPHGRQPDQAGGDAGALPPRAAAARRATPRPCWPSSAWTPRRSPACANAARSDGRNRRRPNQ